MYRMFVKNPRQLFALALMLCAVPSHAAKLSADIGSLVDSYAQQNIFSGSVLVARDGKVIYSGAKGLANRAENIPNTEATRHNIGSMGKTFTAVAIMQLAEQGKLQLTDPIGKYLHAYPHPDKESITVAHLLNHSGGTGNYMGHPSFRGRMGELKEISDFLPLIYDHKPSFPPGTRYSYSNSGMVLLGAIVEKASGMRYADYLQKHVFAPAGMTESGLWRERDPLPQRSLGYTRRPDGTYADNVNDVPPPASDGGMRTTARDLLKYDLALRGTALLSEASKQRMYTPSGPSEFYGYGWERRPAHGDFQLGHPGGAPGISADLRRYEGSRYVVIVLSNMNQGSRDLTDQIEAALYGKKFALATPATANLLYAFTLARTDPRAAAALLDKNVGHAASLYQSARIRIEAKIDAEQALAALDHYLTLPREDGAIPVAAVWWRKGNALELMGKPADARRAYETALAADSKHEGARLALDKLGPKT
ncbi:MAG TPA: serine hydrolase [Burkholderiaceae bacterium]